MFNYSSVHVCIFDVNRIVPVLHAELPPLPPTSCRLRYHLETDKHGAVSQLTHYHLNTAISSPRIDPSQSIMCHLPQVCGREWNVINTI
jgi:hypothetical protein